MVRSSAAPVESYPYVSYVPAGSVHEKPRVTVLPLRQAVPAAPVSDVIVTVGFTLAIVTTRLSELPAPGSSSLAVTRTVELAGPSGKVSRSCWVQRCRSGCRWCRSSRRR